MCGHTCIVLGPPDSSVEIVMWSQQVASTLAELGPVSLFDLESSFLGAPLHTRKFLAVNAGGFVRKVEESSDAYQFLPRHCDGAVVFALWNGVLSSPTPLPLQPATMKNTLQRARSNILS